LAPLGGLPLSGEPLDGQRHRAPLVANFLRVNRG
jgi:hypothetical protein